MKWIKTMVDMRNDPSIGKIARACQVERSHAVGLVVCVLHQLPAHAVDGKLCGIDPEEIEDWAGWTGTPGTFAAAFLAWMCDEYRTVRSWEKHNGGAIREAERKARAEWEKRAGNLPPSRDDFALPEPDYFILPRAETDQTARGSRAESARPARLRNGTERNETDEEKESVPVAAVAAPVLDLVPESPAPATRLPHYRHFPKALSDALWEYWVANVGGCDYGYFRKTLAPFFHRPDQARDPVAPTDSEIAPALELFAAGIKGGRSSSFNSIKNAAEKLPGLVRILRAYPDDKMTQLTAAESLLHGPPSPKR